MAGAQFPWEQYGEAAAPAPEAPVAKAIEAPLAQPIYPWEQTFSGPSSDRMSPPPPQGDPQGMVVPPTYQTPDVMIPHVGDEYREQPLMTHDGLPARLNSDGSYSTEVSITVTDPRLNGGLPTNIPSLWGGKELNEYDAVTAALSSGNKYPSFGSIDDAVAAAKARSAAGGASAPQVPPPPVQQEENSSFWENVMSAPGNFYDRLQPPQQVKIIDDVTGGYLGRYSGRGVDNMRKQGNLLAALTGVLSPEEFAANIAEINRTMTPRDPSVEAGLKEIGDAEGFWNSFWEVLTNPKATGAVVLESLPQSVPIIGGGIAGGTAGAATPVPGGAIVGAGAGAGTMSFAVEYLNTVLEQMEQAGVDMNDPQKIVAAFQNEELMAKAKESGVKRGIPIAIFDAISMGLASRIAAPTRKVVKAAGAGDKTAKVAGATAEIGTQAGLGGGGEAAAQLNEKGKIDNMGEVVLEGVAEAVTGVGEIGANQAIDAMTPDGVKIGREMQRQVDSMQPVPGAAEQTARQALDPENAQLRVVQFPWEQYGEGAPLPGAVTAGMNEQADKPEPEPQPVEQVAQPQVQTVNPQMPQQFAPQQMQPQPQVQGVSPIESPNAGGTLAANQGQVSTVTGQKIDVNYEIVEGKNLRQATADLQPRDRERASSDAQIREIATGLDPQRLGYSAEADRGAPIIGPDNIIESGNGRVRAINMAYDMSGAQAEAYRRFLVQSGFPEAANMERPVLVRRRTTQMDDNQRRQFVIEANQSATMSMSSTEQAGSDTAKMTMQVMGAWRGGEVTSAANRDFVRKFIESVVPASERNQMMGRDGQLSIDGKRRIENAMLGKAFENPEILAQMTESTDNNIRSISGALLDIAGRWAQMRDEINAGRIPAEYDVTPQLVEAAQAVSQMRAENLSAADWVAQEDMLNPRDPVTVALVKSFFDARLTRAAGRDKIVDVLNGYVDTVMEQSTESMFGDQVQPVDVIEQRTNIRNQEAQGGQQQTLFTQGAGGIGASASNNSGSQGRTPLQGNRQGAAGEGQGAGTAGDAGNAETAQRPEGSQNQRTDTQASPVEGSEQTQDDGQPAGYLDKKDIEDLTKDDPALAAVVAAPEERVITENRAKKHGFMSQEEANDMIGLWRENALNEGETLSIAADNSDKYVISLFDSTGMWARPWAEAGYNVITIDLVGDPNNPTISINGEEGDISNLNVEWFQKMGVDDAWAVLAACPCTDFAASGARWWGEKDATGQTEKSKELVYQTMRVIEYLRPPVWAIENPVGRIEKQTGLPPYRMSFNPNHFGNPYTKKTLLWGSFNAELPLAPVEPTEGSKMHSKYGGSSARTKAARSATPEGFAYSFFNANSYNRLKPAERTHLRFPAIDKQLIFKSLLSGMSERDLATAIEDQYYDGDIEAAEKILSDFIAEKDASDLKKRGNDDEAAQRKKDLDDALLQAMLGGRLKDEAPSSTSKADAGREKNQRFRGTQTQNLETVASFTKRTSIYENAFYELGADPAKASLWSPVRQFDFLAKGLRDTYQLSFVQKTKRANIREGIDQLLDGYRNMQFMAHVLDLPSSAIGLEGTLGLVLRRNVEYLGAYYPHGGPIEGVITDAPTISIPRRSNSFAHEWGHAFDYWLMGKYAEGELQGTLSAAVRTGEPVSDVMPQDVKESFTLLMRTLFFDRAAEAQQIMDLERKIEVAKTDEARKKYQDQLDKVLSGQSKSRKDRSDYYKQQEQYVKRRGGDLDYWRKPTEMLARAFEAYVSFKVEAAGGSTEFIGKGSEAYQSDATDRLELTFPKNSDRFNIFRAFDLLFDSVHREKVFKDGSSAARPRDVILSNPATYFRDSINTKNTTLKGVFQGEMEQMQREVRQWKAFWNRPSDGLGPVERVGRALEGVYRTNRGAVLKMEKRYRKRGNNAAGNAIWNITKRLASDPGAGRSTFDGGTYTEALDREMMRYENRLDGLIERHGILDFTEKEQAELRSVLTAQGVEANSASPKVAEAGAALRRYMNDLYSYMQNKGLDVGYLEDQGYLTRILDEASVIENWEDFVKDAKKVYEVVFDRDAIGFEDGITREAINDLMKFGREARIDFKSDDFKAFRQARNKLNRLLRALDAANNEGDADKVAEAEAALDQFLEENADLFQETYEKVRDIWAEAAANNWAGRIMFGSPEGWDSNSPRGNFMKQRKLPPEADKLLDAWYIADPLERVRTYTRAAIRKTEYNLRFGKPAGSRGNSQLHDLLEGLVESGVSKADRAFIEKIIAQETGTVRSGLPGGLEAGLDNFRTVSAITLLGRVVLTSLVEPLTVGLQTGKAFDGLKGLAMTIQEIMPTATVRDRRALARALGIVANPMTAEMLSNRIGGQHKESRIVTRAAGGYYRRVGLTGLTNAQRRSSMQLGINYFYSLSEVILDERATDSEKDAARRELMDFGLQESQLDEFAAWMTQFDDRLPTPEEVTDVDGRLTDFGEMLATGIGRLTTQSIQVPRGMDAPFFANTPIGRITFMLLRFSMAFFRNIIIKNVKKVQRESAARGKLAGANVAARQFVAPLALLYAGHVVLSIAREIIFNPDRWEEEKEKNDKNPSAFYRATGIPNYIWGLSFSRAGFTGIADPVYNAIYGLRYQRDLANVFIGAGGAWFFGDLQAILEGFQRNSDANNRTETRQIKAAYEITAQPAMALLTGLLPAGRATGYGLGALYGYLSSPAFKSQFAEWFVGPQDPKGKRSSRSSGGASEGYRIK